MRPSEEWTRARACRGSGRLGRYSIALLAPLALSLSPDATAGAGPDVRVLSSLETVRRSHTPGGAREARIEAARGEAESFQVVVHAGAAAIGALSVEAEPLVGPGGARIAPS